MVVALSALGNLNLSWTGSTRKKTFWPMSCRPALLYIILYPLSLKPSVCLCPLAYRCPFGLPAASAASTAIGLATGAAVVALAALGGFPDLAAAEAPAWVGPTKLVLDPILLYFEVAFVARIILSWYPKVQYCCITEGDYGWRAAGRFCIILYRKNCDDFHHPDSCSLVSPPAYFVCVCVCSFNLVYMGESVEQETGLIAYRSSVP